MRRSSTETKKLILDAARERFARDGYERTTIRAVAADADIDPSMVMRYYGNKENLFATAATFDLELPDLATVPKSRIGATMVRHFLDRWEADDALLLLLRTAVTNDIAAERMQQICAQQIEVGIQRLGGDRKTAARRAGLAATQVLGLALCRYVLRFAPVAELSRDEVVEQVGPVLQRYLTR